LEGLENGYIFPQKEPNQKGESNYAHYPDNEICHKIPQTGGDEFTHKV